MLSVLYVFVKYADLVVVDDVQYSNSNRNHALKFTDSKVIYSKVIKNRIIPSVINFPN